MLIVVQAAIYRKVNDVLALADTVTATTAKPSISWLAPSCANPLVSGKSSPTKDRGEYCSERPTFAEVYAQEGHFPALLIPPSVLPSLRPQI